MALTRGFIKNVATTPLDARLMDMAQIVGNADGSPRTGVLDGDGRVLVTALATMNVAVAAADFVTSKGTADGVVIFTNDGTVNVPITPAPASNSRIDVIYVKHNDNTTADPNSLPVFGVQPGNAAAIPLKPAIPTGALELATLRVYAGTTAANGGTNILTNTYQMTASRGGIVPFRTRDDLIAWTNPMVGQHATVLNTSDGGDYRYQDGAWRRIGGKFIGCKVRRTSGLALASGTFWAIPFQTDIYDTADLWAVASSTRLYAPIAGVYRISATVGFLGSFGGRLALDFRLNGVANTIPGGELKAAGATEAAGQASTTLVMAAGEYVEVFIYQDSGATQTTSSSTYSTPTAALEWIGDL